MELHENIKRIREANNISQRELGRRIKMSGQMISKIEKNETVPSMGTLLKIADALEVSITDIVKNTSQHITTDYWQSEMIKELNGIKKLEESKRGYSGLDSPLQDLIGSIHTTLLKNDEHFIKRYSYNLERLLESLVWFLSYSTLDIPNGSIDKLEFLEALNSINDFIKYKESQLSNSKNKEGE